MATITTHTQHAVSRVLSITLVLNMAVAFAKIVLGMMTGALAITADGVHSLTDGAGNIAGLIAVRLSATPPDKDHPYGHTKFETVGALLIGVLLFVTAWEVVTGVIERLGDGAKPQVNALTLGLLAVTLVINICVSRYQTRAGNRLNSTILLADAQNTRTDVFVTLSVLMSSILVALTGWVWLDLLATLLVVVLIVRAGWGIIRQNGRVLVDTAPYTPETLLPFVATVPDVQSVVRLRSRGTTDAAFIDVDVRVHPDTTVRQTQTIATAIRQNLNNHLHGIEEIEVHFVAGSLVS
jgi:cation diffusion facilitator family transporter